MEQPSNLEKIQEFLNANGASQFSRLLYNLHNLTNLVDNPDLKLIMAPTNAAMNRLVEKTGKSITNLSGLAMGRDLFANHLSFAPIQSYPPFYIASTGVTYGVNPTDIENFRGQAETNIDGITVRVVDKIFTNPATFNTLVAYRDPGVFGILDYQNFINLINIGQLKGKSLINLCETNSYVNEFCNKPDANGQDIYDRLVSKMGPSLANKNFPANLSSREIYRKLYHGYQLWTNYRTVTGKFGPINNVREDLHKIEGFDTIVHIENAYFYSVLLDSAGKVYVRGIMPEITDVQIIKPFGDIPIQLPVPGDVGIVKVCANQHHILLLGEDSKVYFYGKSYASRGNIFPNRMGGMDEDLMYRNIIYTGYDNILDIALTVSGIVLVNKDMQTVTLLGDARNQFPFLLEGADWAETVHMGAKLLRVGVGKSKGSYGLCYIIYDFSPTASGQQMGIGGPSKGLNISIKSMSSRGGSLIELGDTNVDDVKVYAGISRGVVLIKNVLKYVFDAHRSFPVGDFPVREISYVESNPNSSNDMAYIIYGKRW